ncbi:MAG: DMT family transporter [Pseudomonadota bacterium]|nr:DMT family transporter [Pseudomonadota bacterium]
MLRRIYDIPWILLVLTPMFWAGNLLLGRSVHETVPPIALATCRWALAFAILLPFAWRDIRADLAVYRRHWARTLLLSVFGVSCFNTMLYIGVADTQAINGSLIQSTMPVWIALLSLLLFRDRLGGLQAVGIVISITGVLTILVRGHFADIGDIEIRNGDLWLVLAVICYATYSTLLRIRPPVRPLGFVAVTFLLGDLVLLPFWIGEMAIGGRYMPLDMTALLSVLYVAIFPSILAYIFWNRGVELVGANRAGIFIHLVPAFVTVGAIGFLGEVPHFYHLAGIGLILLGVVMTSRGRGG